MSKEKYPQPNQSSHDQLRRRFHDDEANYNLLRSNMQRVRERINVWDTDFTLEKYAMATDGVVGVLDGSIKKRDLVDPRFPEQSLEAPDKVIYLDKSARPVAWFVDGLWDQMAKPGAKKPESEFLNIDRAVWFMRQGYNSHDAERSLGPNDFDIDKVSNDDIARIRALLIDENIDQDNWREDVWNHPTRLDGANVVIIDEVKNRGGTLAIATQLIRRAVPGAIVSGNYYWKGGRYALGSGQDNLQMESAPVWYSKEDVWGRGVGDISKSYYEHLPDTPENFKRKLGWIALSAPHHDPRTFEHLSDRKADMLKQDIAYLSYALAEGKVLAMPSIDREVDDAVDILTEKYPDLSVRDISKYRAERNQQNST